ncbi:MAG: hypothetical protein JRC91_01555 [Deltaproteobacteria bacterium]|nr:hypothetical protein [Deltaproteobacteria bacterium]
MIVQPALAPEVYELEKLLKQYPVSILATEKEIKLREAMSWVDVNWKVSQQISNLVFMSQPVFEYICAHPAKIITGKNLIMKEQVEG